MDHVAVAAMGADRPGIVARVAAALEDAGLGIEDSSMTNLRGTFAMLLVVAGARPDQVEATLAPVAAELGLVLEVGPAPEDAGPGGGEYVVAAYGPDRTGLVAALSAVMADLGVSIDDFGSRLGASEVFAMWFNVVVPDAVSQRELEAALARAGEPLGLSVSVHRAEAVEA